MAISEDPASGASCAYPSAARQMYASDPSGYFAEHCITASEPPRRSLKPYARTRGHATWVSSNSARRFFNWAMLDLNPRPPPSKGVRDPFQALHCLAETMRAVRKQPAGGGGEAVLPTREGLLPVLRRGREGHSRRLRARGSTEDCRAARSTHGHIEGHDRHRA